MYYIKIKQSERFLLIDPISTGVILDQGNWPLVSPLRYITAQTLAEAQSIVVTLASLIPEVEFKYLSEEECQFYDITGDAVLLDPEHPLGTYYQTKALAEQAKRDKELADKQKTINRLRDRIKSDKDALKSLGVVYGEVRHGVARRG